MVTIRVPATSANIGPGFDTLGLALNLHNTIEIEECSQGVKIVVSGEGAEDISTGEDNIVYQAAVKVFEKVGYKPAGIYLKLTNSIPVARGLGSSAAALVGGVMGANMIAGNKLTKQEMLDIVTEFEGHPDNVAPAIFGGLIASVVLDDEIIWRKIDLQASKMKFIVAIPEFTLSTKLSRQVLPKQVPFEDAVYNLSRVGMLLMAFQNTDIELLAKVMDDRIHQPYRSELVPGMAEVLKVVKDNGIPVALSGAGPTLIAIAGNEEEKVGQLMKKTFDKYNVNCKIKILEPNNVGAEVI